MEENSDGKLGGKMEIDYVGVLSNLVEKDYWE